jgi:hypothetical protein
MIKQAHPLKVDDITKIVQMIVIVAHSSSDGAIWTLTPSPLLTIIARREGDIGARNAFIIYAQINTSLEDFLRCLSSSPQ